MLICVLLLPASMIIMGIVYCKGGYPKEINDSFGYRTKLSRRSQEAWDFAQKLFGKLSLIMGAVTLLPSVVPMLFVIGGDADVCGWTGGYVVLVQMIIMILIIPFTENAIKKKFPA